MIDMIYTNDTILARWCQNQAVNLKYIGPGDHETETQNPILLIAIEQ